MSGFVWCAYGCGSGQLHSSLNPRVFCISCYRLTCFFYHVPWYEGMTCKEYGTLAFSDDAVNLRYLKIFTKQCPKCKVNIEKNEGYDHMTCTECSTEFCWDCLAEFSKYDSLYTCAHKITCIYFRMVPVRRSDPQPARRRRFRTAFCTLL